MSNAMPGWPGNRIDQDHSRSVQCPMLCIGGLEIEVVAKIIPGLSGVQCYAGIMVAWRKDG